MNYLEKLPREKEESSGIVWYDLLIGYSIRFLFIKNIFNQLNSTDILV